MPDEDDSTTYFIRVRGRVLGPYDVNQLKVLRGRGQFSRANEISVDRQTWESAATIEHLLGGTKAFSKAKIAKEEEEVSLAQAVNSGPPSRSMTPVWYYSVGSERFGPVTILELRSMVASLQLMPADLVWKEGLPDWSPVSDVQELSAVIKQNPVSPTNQATTAAQNFCFACGSPTDSRAEICPKCGVRQHHVASGSEKNRITAALLALFLGGIGVHHFYLGNTLAGVIYLLFCWTFIPALVAFVEFIVFLCMSDASFAAKYARHS